MPTRYIVPLGFIDEITKDGSTFTLTNPEESQTLRIDAPVTVWRYSPEQLAMAKIRGVISAVGYVTATFTTVESRIDPRWPKNEDLMREKTPVYLAVENSFEPDPSRMLTREQAETMRKIAREYKKLTGGGSPDEGNSPDPRKETQT